MKEKRLQLTYVYPVGVGRGEIEWEPDVRVFKTYEELETFVNSHGDMLDFVEAKVVDCDVDNWIIEVEMDTGLVFKHPFVGTQEEAQDEVLRIGYTAEAYQNGVKRADCYRAEAA